MSKSTTRVKKENEIQPPKCLEFLPPPGGLHIDSHGGLEPGSRPKKKCWYHSNQSIISLMPSSHPSSNFPHQLWSPPIDRSAQRDRGVCSAPSTAPAPTSGRRCARATKCVQRRGFGRPRVQVERKKRKKNTKQKQKKRGETRHVAQKNRLPFSHVWCSLSVLFGLRKKPPGPPSFLGVPPRASLHLRLLSIRPLARPSPSGGGPSASRCTVWERVWCVHPQIMYQQHPTGPGHLA